ncbi:MAG: peptidoglycan DD-metalloendopeptidase family protein [Gammaproteobacteria bacterium]|nr:peptidoglycan DD-metalloendopeptidase family protein [Gammaproteobacteria bacterium]
MRYPKPHFFLVGVLSLGLTTFVIAQFNNDAEDDRFTTESVLLSIPDVSTNRLAGVAEDNLPADTPTSSATARETFIEKSAQVAPGDSMARIFKKLGIPGRELALLLESKPLGPRLKNIFPGHDLRFTLNADNELLKLAYSPGPLETLEFERVGDRFIGHDVQRAPERLTAYKHAKIDHSLFIASQRAGLDDALTMRIAQIFQWDIDFVLDIRKGDEFYVLFEELYLEDKFIGFGDVLAAEFVNQGDSYQALQYEDPHGQKGYFNPRGENMKKAFLRAPVEFSRISSNFNLRRKHPLHKRTMPHRGIDYAAPRGTPILAAGDGKVVTASKSSSNGNYVVLQHGEQFVTKYLHLSKFARGVRAGRRIVQGDTIGYVGSTGWATGPHLHYEFLVNGSHMNPRTVKLPDATPVPAQELEAFNTQARPLISLLNNYKQQIHLALVR